MMPNTTARTAASAPKNTMNGNQAMEMATMPSTIAAVAAELVPVSSIGTGAVGTLRVAPPTSIPIGSTKRDPSADTSAVHAAPLK